VRLKLRNGFHSILATVLCAVAFGAGCSLPMQVESVGAFAGRAVTCGELRGYAAELAAYPGASAVPPNTVGELFEQYVVAQMLVAEARRSGIDRSATYLDRYREARRSLLQEILEEDLENDISLTGGNASGTADLDADETGSVVADGDDFDPGDRVRARIILIRLEADAPRSAANRAAADLQAVQAEFLSGVPFADLAARHSQHESARRGGTLSPRQSAELGPAFAGVTNRLENGEISDVVRLADGLALILVEDAGSAAAPQRQPQQQQPYVAADSFEQRARKLANQRRHRRAALLAEARSLWTVKFVTGALATEGPEFATVPVAFIDDTPLTLADLGLAHRPPLLREAVSEALDDELLVRFAESRATPAVLANLEALRRGLLAEVMQSELVRAHLVDVAEPALRKRYDIEIERFRRAERRVFEVVRVAAEAGNLQEARAAASAIARIWSPDGPLHQRNRAEIWGPLTQSILEGRTSTQFARAAFALAANEVSAPVLLPSTDEAGNESLGYAVMRTYAVEPAGVIPFAEALPSLVVESGDAAAEARSRIRAGILQQVGLETRPPLNSCSMTPGSLEEWIRVSAPDAAGSTGESSRRGSVWDPPRLDRRNRAVEDTPG